MKIVTDLNVLHQISGPVFPEEKESLRKTLIDAIINNERAIGIAAIQLGIPKRAFAMKTAGPHSAENEIKVFMNPTIVDQYDPIVVSESCLSFPGESVTTKRFKHVCIEDADQKCVMSDLMAVVVQHEYAHIDGKTMHDFKYSAGIGRNDPCPCGSGKKYKKCCANK